MGGRDPQYLYWLDRDAFVAAKDALEKDGYRLTAALLTPCQVLHASGKNVVYASPEVWSRICDRQSTWYRSSRRSGQYMLLAGERLPEPLEPYFDATLAASDFQPDRLPTRTELQSLVESEEYQSRKPEGWEAIGFKDALLFKVLFTLMRFWKRGDNLRRRWLEQRSNHANFLARRFTTRIDGEDVPYSITENGGVCSSCAEFFNVVEEDSRKLVRACPGSVMFGGAPRHVYLDVLPQKRVRGL